MAEREDSSGLDKLFILTTQLQTCVCRSDAMENLYRAVKILDRNAVLQVTIASP